MAEEEANNSNSSNGSKSKMLLKAIGIEGMFIALVLLVIFGILSYLNIIPLSKYLTFLLSVSKPAVVGKSVPGQKGFRDPNISPAVPTLDPQLYSLPIDPTIRVVSDIKQYQISSMSEQKLLEVIKNQWGFFGKKYNTTLGTTGNTPIKLIVVHLVSHDQGYASYKGSDGKPYLSSSIKVLPGTLDIYVYILPTILEDPTKSSADKGGYLLTGFLTNLSQFNAYVDNRQVSQSDTLQLNQLFTNLSNQKKLYFQITKI